MSPSERSQQQREATRQHILDALERVLERHGLRGLSIRKVAREAEVAVGTVYLYFEHKDALLHAWTLRGFGYYQARIDALPAETWQDPVRALEAICRSYIGFVLDHADAYRLALSPEIKALSPVPPMDQPAFLEDPGSALATRHLQALVTDGRLAPDRINHAMASLLTATQGLALALLDQPELDPGWRQELIDFHVELMIRGLLSRPGGVEA
jgi:AcrR family transcriptional regulator